MSKLNNASRTKGRVLKSYKHLLTDTTILFSIISSLGYLVTYYYQKGFNRFYSIDEVFIDDITFTQIVISASYTGSIILLSLIFLYLYYIINIIVYDLKVGQYFIIKTLLVWFLLFPIIIIFILDIFYILNSALKLGIYTVIIALILFTMYALQFPRRKDGIIKTFFNSWRPDEYSLQKIKQIVNVKIFKSSKVLILSLFFLYAIICFIANLIGGTNAERKVNYYLVDDSEETYILINKYDKKLIIAPFNLEENKLSTTYKFIEIESLDSAEIEVRPIELLTPPSLE